MPAHAISKSVQRLVVVVLGEVVGEDELLGGEIFFPPEMLPIASLNHAKSHGVVGGGACVAV